MPDDVQESVLVGDLLEDSRRRLGLTCLVFAACFAVSYTSLRVYGVDAPAGSRLVPDVSTLVTIMVALVLAVLARRRALHTKALLNAAVWLGPVFVLGLAITEASAFVLVSQMNYPGAPFEGISWSCTVILLFPILIPSTLGQSAISSFVSALMFPGMLFVFSSTSGASGPDAFWLALGAGIPTMVCALAAVLTTQVLVTVRAKLRDARKIGVYELVEKLGEGGMGEVWRARHHRLARPAAIKLVKSASTPSPRALLRFEREAQATAQLTCPHTVTVFDFGIAEEGNFFYVMELLDGMDLNTLVHNYGPQSAERVIHWLVQVCLSLEEAHSVGLVHRDIKPANIVCCRYGLELDFIKVLDFGLVAEIEGSTGGDTRSFVGTPGYAAPEAVLADRPIGPSQDIYSLGCVAYFLLTGAGVFAAKSPVKVALMHVSDKPVRASDKLGESIESELEGIVMSCLEKAPERRPASVADIRKRLEALNKRWDQDDALDWWANVAGDITVDEEGSTLVEQTREIWRSVMLKKKRA